MKRQNLNPVLRLLRSAFLLTLAVFFLPGLLLRRPAQAAVPPAATQTAAQEETAPAPFDPASEANQPADTAPSPSESKTGFAANDPKTKDRQTSSPVPASASDSSKTLRVLINGKVQSMELEEYLWGVIAAEMPASFEPEALKAQAIAARTYTLYQAASPSSNHLKAHICNDPGCCQAWISRKDRLSAWEKGKQKEYAQKITTALAETRGQVLYYQDKPIMAVFHASSAGRTKSAQTVWGKALPYLQSVSSPETQKQVPNYYSVVSVSRNAFCKAIAQACPKLTLPEDPAKWFGAVSYDSGGLPCAIEIGGQSVPTTILRTLFHLRSAT